VVINPDNLLAAFLAFDTRFQQVFKSVMPWGEKIATTMPSNTKEGRTPWLKALPTMREWLGPRVVNNLSTNIQSLVNKKFELTFGITREDFEDDIIGVYGPAVEEMARQAAKWPDYQLAAALQAGTSSLCHDGSNFFSATHKIDPDGVSTTDTQSNYTSSGMALTAAHYDAARAERAQLKREDNKPMGVGSTLLIVPPQLEFTAKQIVQADLIVAAAGANAATGSQTNVYKGTADVLVIPELANEATAWYLADDKRAVKPLIWQLRQSPEFTYLNRPDDPNVFLMDEFLFGTRARGVAGYGPYYLISKYVA